MLAAVVIFSFVNCVTQHEIASFSHSFFHIAAGEVKRLRNHQGKRKLEALVHYLFTGIFETVFMLAF